MPLNKRLGYAKEADGLGEELKKENFNGVNTEAFEKAVIMLQSWAEMTMREMEKHKKFRIEINYNVEAKKTDFCIYTSIEAVKDGIEQEYSKS